MDIVTHPLVLEAPAYDVERLEAPLPIAIRGKVPGARRPAVVFVFGFSGAAQARMFGGRPSVETRGYADWANLCADAGAVAITSLVADPVTDLQVVLGHVRAHADELGVDPDRIALWACSGNVPVALDALTRGGIARAALLYGYMFGPQVEAVAPRIGFENPAAGKTVADLPAIPLLVLRAGKDATPLLNDTIDAFVPAAVAAGLPLTFINAPASPHAFDLFDDNDTSRALIRQVVAFITA